MKKSMQVIMLVAALAFIIGMASYGNIIRSYEGYEGEINAVIRDMNTRVVSVHAINHDEYKLFYVYDVDGVSYEGTSEWLSESGGFRIGQEMPVRYDKAHPELSLLERDMQVSNAHLWSAVICVLILIGIRIHMGRLEN